MKPETNESIKQNSKMKRQSNLLYDPFALAMSSFHSFGRSSISVMRWWSPAFGLAGFFLGLAATFFFLGLLAVFFLELLAAFLFGRVGAASLSLSRFTISAFNPDTLRPRSFSSCLSSTTLREDQSFSSFSVREELFSKLLLLRTLLGHRVSNLDWLLLLPVIGETVKAWQSKRDLPRRRWWMLLVVVDRQRSGSAQQTR